MRVGGLIRAAVVSGVVGLVPAEAFAGTSVTIEGWLARNGTPTANTNTITLADGRRLFAGTPPTEGGSR